MAFHGLKGTTSVELEEREELAASTKHDRNRDKYLKSNCFETVYDTENVDFYP